MIKKLQGSKIIDNIKKINAARPQPHLVHEAARIIKKGGIVSFPTKCLYGLGADALNFDAVEKIFAIKRRSHKKPLFVLIKSRNNLDRLVKHVPSNAFRIMDRFWPGGITIVFEAKDNLPVNLTAGTGKIGIRLPKQAVAVALLNTVKGPITGTSANISNHAGCSQISDLDPLIAKRLDLILDAGPLKGGVGSTVIDVTTEIPTVLREGEVSSREVLAVCAAK